MAHSASQSHGVGQDFSHPMPVWQLIAVFLALIVLTVLTVFQSTLELGNTELIVSLAIATVKASLVILFFMHMIHDKPLHAILFIGSFIFVALFLGFTLMDAGAYNDVIELIVVPSDVPANPMN
jgi:cytochrome c oxidase subunit 4